jgi:hypothetical protein
MLFVFVAIKLWILHESKYPLVLQNQFVYWAITTHYVSNSKLASQRSTTLFDCCVKAASFNSKITNPLLVQSP